MKRHIYEDKQYWLALGERYMEAETTDQEEKQLARFLASPYAESVEFDELRAVMGFMAVGKKRYAKRQISYMQRYVRIGAAIVAGLLMVAWGSYEMERRQNVCIAYVYGERFTDPERVMLEMESSLKSLHYGETERIVEEQLSSIFQTLDEESESNKSK
ncbi:MAG: hypothetical protein E7085_05995 [Parabacteroides distasonis]|nr:hypothetical protein [Parabacteroides distasonis]MBQ4162434.1 hypothetical protein [Parabacteroides sp.]MBR2496991.1 hypothetical protein [Parabacteroides sp.]